MLDTVLLDRALCLPKVDIEALLQGHLVVAVSKAAVQKGWSFLLCPYIQSLNATELKQQYRPNVLPLVKATVTQQLPETLMIGAWARCEYLKVLHEIDQLKALSSLTIWTVDSLKKTLEQRQHLFLAILRVYKLPEVIAIPQNAVTSDKFGKFVGLPMLGEQFREPIKITQKLPILDDVVFNQRKLQIEELRLPAHPQLEELQKAVSELALVEDKARSLDDLIQHFLGWKNKPLVKQSKQEFDWIYEIDTLGNRSKELDQEKSNYQAGTDFENVVRDGLEFLGFSIDEAYKGGAGGLDLFCSKPYPLVGECKAGKTIPSGTTQELVRLGGMHLGADQFLTSAKLIIGPGQPTQKVLTAATEWRVSIINPMSLQKLVELQAQYPGSVDLIELKKYLEPGQIDHRIDEYIEEVLKKIKLRAHIVQVVERHLAQIQAADANVDTLFGVYCGSNPPQVVTPKDFHEILVELSSPLTGYLGRRKGIDGTDRFYFLRDMPK